MAVFKDTYKEKEFLIDHGTPKRLHVNGKEISFQLFPNNRFYTDLLPYQDFENLIEMAKEIIDKIPNS